MTITNHPLHRSGRALLTHPAPALGDDAKSPQWIWVMDPRRWQPAVNQSVHPFPREPLFLAPSPKRSVPVTRYLKTKRLQRLQVHRNTIIPIVSLNNRPKPLSYLGHRPMHSSPQFLSDFPKLCSFPLAYRLPDHRKHPVASLLATDVREAKKIECLRFPFPTLFSIVGCISAKLDQPRFLGMQFQLELAESLRQFLVKPLSLRPVLKTHDEVICPSHDDHVAFGFCLSPVVHPEVEHIVQEDIGHQRRSTPALWRSFFTARPPSFLQHACVQPFSNQTHDPLVRYPVLDEFHQPFVVNTIEERADVSIQHPVHLLRQHSDIQCIQRIVRVLPRSVAVRESKKVRLVDCIHHLHRRSLDNLIFQRCDSERPLPPVSFGDVHSSHRSCSVCPPPQPPREFLKIALKLLSILSPRFPIYSRCCVTLQSIIGFAQHAQVVDVVHEAGEPLPLILHGCLPYPTQRTLHVYPVQCPVRVLPRRFPFGQTPSLHPLRRRFAGFVRALRHYYGSVRLPAVV